MGLVTNIATGPSKCKQPIKYSECAHKSMCAYNVKFTFKLSGQYSFVLKMFVYFLRLLHQVHFRLDFFMEANDMNSDQTAPLGAV